jgi:hypothetical protein
MYCRELMKEHARVNLHDFNKCESADRIENKLKEIFQTYDDIIKHKPFLLLRLPETFELFMKKVDLHFKQYMVKVTMEELVQKLLK